MLSSLCVVDSGSRREPLQCNDYHDDCVTSVIHTIRSTEITFNTGKSLVPAPPERITGIIIINLQLSFLFHLTSVQPHPPTPTQIHALHSVH